MTMTSTQFLALTEPGLDNIWHEPWPDQEQVHSRIFNIRPMPKMVIEDAKMTGVGPLQVRNEGAATIYDDAIAPVTRQYRFTEKSLGYKITQRFQDADLYNQVMEFERGLRRQGVNDVETATANIFNNGFTTANTGFDSLALFSTAHTRLDGGATFRNRPSTDVDLSLSALMDAMVDISTLVDDRGIPIRATPQYLLIPPQYVHIADELLLSSQKPGTANNDVNAVRRWNLQVIIWNYLTDTDAWFIINSKHDLNFMWWKQPVVNSEVEFDTDTIKRKMVQAYAVGFGESGRSVWGTTGAA